MTSQPIVVGVLEAEGRLREGQRRRHERPARQGIVGRSGGTCGLSFAEFWLEPSFYEQIRVDGRSVPVSELGEPKTRRLRRGPRVLIYRILQPQNSSTRNGCTSNDMILRAGPELPGLVSQAAFPWNTLTTRYGEQCFEAGEAELLAPTTVAVASSRGEPSLGQKCTATTQDLLKGKSVS